jgi:C4-dicarboxylate-specific signal transduction histidine kinase
MDSPLTLVLLTLIAAATVAQAVLLAVLSTRAKEVVVRLEAVEREVRPHLARAGDVIESVADLTEAAARSLPEIESAVRQTAGKVRWAGDLVETLAFAPLRPLARGLALWRAWKRGAETYRAIRVHPTRVGSMKET